jgi:uncharacterized protein (DUF362 family)
MQIDKPRSCSFDEDGKIKCPVLSEPRKIYTSSDLKIRRVSDKAEVGIGRDPEPAKATEDAVNRIGGMCRFVKPEDMVGIKINITGGTSQNKASWTSPDVTKKVVEMVRNCGGKPILFDSSMIWTDMEPIARKEGWYEWADENKVEVVDLHHLPVIPFDFGDDGLIRVDKVSRLMPDLDVLISIPKMKTHLLTTVTIGLKNNYGLLPRADKGIYHAKDIDSVVAEVNKAIPTTLTIVDGTIAGDGESGPLTPVEINDYNTVIASNDIACGDAVSAKFMGFERPTQIRHLKLAGMMGVGDVKCVDDPEVKAEIDRHFGSHPKDGNFSIPDPRVIESLTDFMKVIARNPGGAALFSNLADMVLGNTSYYTTGFMQTMLTGFSKMSRRYIGKDTKRFNIHGLNLHPEDENDAAMY